MASGQGHQCVTSAEGASWWHWRHIGMLVAEEQVFLFARSNDIEALEIWYSVAPVPHCDVYRMWRHAIWRWASHTKEPITTITQEHSKIHVVKILVVVDLETIIKVTNVVSLMNWSLLQKSKDANETERAITSLELDFPNIAPLKTTSVPPSTGPEDGSIYGEKIPACWKRNYYNENVSPSQILQS